MKIKSIFLFIWGFLTAGSVFAQTPEGYLQLCIDGNEDAYVSQYIGVTPPSAPLGYTCTTAPLKTISRTAVVLDSILTADWNPSTNAYSVGFNPMLGGGFVVYQRKHALTFSTDFQFGQYVEVSKGVFECQVNHTPLKFKLDDWEINGGNHTISNVCLEKEISAGDDSQASPIGFFETLESVNVHNLKLKNISFSVTAEGGASLDASKFGPVGALAGVLKLALLYEDTLTDINISAPMAGGFVGYAENSTLLRIYSDDDLNVFNDVDLNDAEYYAGIHTSDWGSDYRAFIGGLVGYAVNLNLKQINVIPKVQNRSADTSTVIGGLVGMYALSQKNNNRPEQNVMEIDSLTMLVKGDNQNTYPKVVGGKTMGGLVGEAAIYKNLATESMNLSINHVNFNGSISNPRGNDVHAGGMIGRSLVDRGASVKILNSEVTLKMNESLSNAGYYQYSVGGLVGEGACVASEGTVTAESFISITNTKTYGSLSLSKKDGVENVSADVFMGGLAGRACLARNADALSGNSSAMELSVTVNGLRGHSVGGSETSAIDTVMVGGFVGKAVTRPNKSGSYVAGDSVLMVRDALFTGTIEVRDSLNLVRAGGFIGSFADNAGVLYVAFENARLNNVALMTLNPGVTATFPVQGSAAIGGLCGYCIMPNSVDRVMVRGGINVQGDFSQADSLFVGGAFGGLLSSKDFSMQNLYYIGTMTVPGSGSSDKIDEGYLAGKLTLNGTKVFRKIVSTYHNGNDKLDAFGLFEGGNAHFLPSAQGDDWKLIEDECSGLSKLNGNVTCWDIRYNVRNGDTESINENFNGTKTDSSMKTPEFADFLNDPFSAAGNVYWGHEVGSNGDFPYLLENPIILNPPSSSSVAVSSSSSAPVSSSSFWFPTFSSSSFQFPTFSSCSFQFPTFSSSSITWPWPFSSSSIELPPPASSSSVFIPSSSSELPQPESSSVEEPAPNNAPKVVVVEAPKILSHRLDWSGSLARLVFSASADTLGSKVVASVRVRSGDVVVLDTLLVDSVPGILDQASLNFAATPGDSLVYEISLQGDTVSALANGGSRNETEVQRFRWQMVSLADVNLRKLNLDEYHVLYRWDESLEMGDYMQYRGYSSDEDVSGTNGYWYGSYDGAALKRDVGKFVDNAEIVWEVDSIHSGWNMVANPYGWVVDLSAIAESDVELWSWDDETGGYGIPTELKPYEAVWLKTSGPQTLQFSAAPKFGENGAKSLAKRGALKKSSDGWTIRATLFDDNGKEDSWNMFGTNSVVSKSDEPPSGMGDHVSLAIVEDGRALARSFKPAAKEMEWTLQLSASSERTAYLKLEGLAEAKATGNKVFVTVDGKTVEAKEGKAIPVKVGTFKKTATVYVAPQAKPELEYAFKDVRVVQSGSMFDVQFVATNGLAGRSVKVDLLDISGKVLSSLSKTSSAGVNNVSFAAPKGGLYIVRIRSGSLSATRKVVLR